MAKPATKQRKILRRLGGLLTAIVLVIAAVPLWFPWVLKPVLNHYGLDYAGYERTSFTRFAVTDLRGDWGITHLKAQRVEWVLPTRWLWEKYVAGTNAVPQLQAQTSTLTILPGSAKTTSGRTNRAPRSFHRTANIVARVGNILDYVLRSGELTNGTIQIASNIMVLPRVNWENGQLHTVIHRPRLSGEIEFIGRTAPNSALQFSANWAVHDLSLHGNFSRATTGWDWTGEIFWRSNRAPLTAQFPTNGWWPQQAELSCPNLIIPAAMVRLPGYEDLTAALAVNVISNQFRLQANGRARPGNEFAANGFPSAEFSFLLEGDPASIRLQKLNVKLPWLLAELTDPIGLARNGELFPNPAQFQIIGDLGKIPGAALAGKVEGQLRIQPHGSAAPTAKFSFSAKQMRAGPLEQADVFLQGEYESLELKLNELLVQGRAGVKLSASGKYDFKKRELVAGQWKFSAASLKAFLPSANSGAISGSGQLGGSLAQLAHHGEITLEQFESRAPHRLDATLTWTGRKLQLDSVQVNLMSGKSIFNASGTVDLRAMKDLKFSATLTNATLRRAETELYALKNPSTISFEGGKTNRAAPPWKLTLNSFDWQGPNRILALAAAVSWPARGNVTGTLTNFSTDDFADFLPANITNLTLTSFVGTAQWSNGPVQATLQLASAWTNRTGKLLRVQAKLAVGETLSVQDLSLQTDVAPSLSITGNIPVKLTLGLTNAGLVWNEAQSIALNGHWEEPDATPFAVPLLTAGNLAVAQPKFDFAITGTPTKPSASLQLTAAMITWEAPGTNFSLLPRLEDFQLRAEIRPDQITLENFSAKLDGQLLKANGTWPLNSRAWPELWSEKKLPDWSQAQGKLQIEGAQVAAISRYLPKLLAPEGELQARLELKPGKQIDGALSLTNAATRPLGNLSPLREITAHVRFDEHRAELEFFRGQIGGQPVHADGYVTIPKQGGLDYQVNLHGTNMPLVHSLQLLLRGDADLQLRGGNDLPPVVSGRVVLHDGLFLQHTADLVSTGPKGPALRPPYFSVTNASVADWKLALTVTGDRFLRARTPVFTGLLSANLNLNGSLREPVLTGDLRVNSGRVLFPFGTLALNQGFVSFSGNDLQGPDLQIQAAGRNYRYEIQLDVKGPANNAVITFSSTPPLASEQILLMLTAGEIPQTDFTYSSGARAGRLATYLGTDLVNRFIGSDGDEDRLIIRTGESISVEGRLTYSIEYRFTDRWSIIGEYDEFNAFNADLKWKVYTR